MPTALILDTNFFLHFRPFDEVSWSSFDLGDEVELVVCAIVIRELEEKKLDRRQKIRERARNSVSRLLSLIESSESRTKAGISVTVVGLEPVAALSDLRLDRSVPDDVLIANAIELQEGHRYERTIIVSNDAGVLLKCRTFGVDYWRPPENLELPELSDDASRELRQLKEENQRLKAARPQLLLRLVERNGSVQLGLWEADEEQLTPVSGEQMRKDYPPLERESALAIGVSERDRLKYNKLLEVYHQEYGDFLVRHNDYLQWRRRAARIEFEVVNDGGVPAEDLDIEVVFGAGIEVLELKNARAWPTPPKLPKRPRNVVEQATLSVRDLLSEYSHPSPALHYELPYLNSIDHISNTRGPWVSTERPEIISWYVKYLKHRECIRLPAALLVVPDESCQGCTVSYMLHAGNIPDPTEGELGFAFAHDD